MTAGLVVLTLIAGVGHLRSVRAAQDARAEVFAAERAFAKTMADRDFAAFQRYLSKEAIFYGQGVTRGPAAVAAAWKPFFDGPTAPFSWEPTSVEVVDSGTLALSSGPVRGPDGRSGSTFNSIWRREADGAWRVVFDKGCQCPPPPKPGDAAAACAP
jgi:ketosteroid isomerase-like protein